MRERGEEADGAEVEVEEIDDESAVKRLDFVEDEVVVRL